MYYYNRELALKYAHTWAMRRNPKYMDFHGIGGDCTNFVSQVLYAGCNRMNYTKEYGWYYINGNNRTPSWTGVKFLYRFLINNTGAGPGGKEVDVSEILPGDIVQLCVHEKGNFDHSLVIVDYGEPKSVNNILVASHSFDSDFFPLKLRKFVEYRFIHIDRVG